MADDDGIAEGEQSPATPDEEPAETSAGTDRITPQFSVAVALNAVPEPP